jgi:hypothetical protein
MAQLSPTALAYYGRLFTEQFMRALGSDIITDRINIAIDPEIADWVSTAGLQEGARLRLAFLTNKF